MGHLGQNCDVLSLLSWAVVPVPDRVVSAAPIRAVLSLPDHAVAPLPQQMRTLILNLTRIMVELGLGFQCILAKKCDVCHAGRQYYVLLLPRPSPQQDVAEPERAGPAAPGSSAAAPATAAGGSGVGFEAPTWLCAPR